MAAESQWILDDKVSKCFGLGEFHALGENGCERRLPYFGFYRDLFLVEVARMFVHELYVFEVVLQAGAFGQFFRLNRAATQNCLQAPLATTPTIFPLPSLRCCMQKTTADNDQKEPQWPSNTKIFFKRSVCHIPNNN